MSQICGVGADRVWPWEGTADGVWVRNLGWGLVTGAVPGGVQDKSAPWGRAWWSVSGQQEACLGGVRLAWGDCTCLVRLALALGTWDPGFLPLSGSVRRC